MFNEGRDTNDVQNKLYTGLANFRVVIINPNKEELAAMGIKREEEPVYLTDESDENGDFKKLKVEIYIDNDDEQNRIKNSISFFLENRISVAGTGTTLFINKYGATAYLQSLENLPEKMSWYDTTGARPAYRNEDLLIDFFRNLLNLSMQNKDEASLENIDQMFATGDVTALRKAAAKRPKNKVKILCGVKSLETTGEDGNTMVRDYQNFYVRGFLRAYTRPNTPPFNKFKGDVLSFKQAGGAPSVDYGNMETLVFKEYSPEAASAATSAQSTSTEAAPNW